MSFFINAWNNIVNIKFFWRFSIEFLNVIFITFIMFIYIKIINKRDFDYMISSNFDDENFELIREQ